MSILTIISIAIGILLIWLVVDYGKNTVLGFWGTFALAMLTTPMLAFLIIMFFFKPKRGLTKIYQLPKRQVH